MARLRPPNPTSQIGELQKQLAALQSQVVELTRQRDAYVADSAEVRRQLAHAQQQWKAAATKEAEYGARLMATHAKLDQANATIAKLSSLATYETRQEIENRTSRDLIACQANLKRSEHETWRFRGAVYLLLSEQRGVSIDNIPESDVLAECQRWEDRFK